MAKKGKLTEQTELTAIQKRFCLQAAILHNVRAAAKMVGISERTAHRWHDLPLAQEYIIHLQEQAFNTAMVALEQLTLSAVLMLNEAMNSDHTDNKEKMRAAIAILDHGIEARKMNLVERRLAALEDRLHLHDIVVKGEVVE